MHILRLYYTTVLSLISIYSSVKEKLRLLETWTQTGRFMILIYFLYLPPPKSVFEISVKMLTDRWTSSTVSNVKKDLFQALQLIATT